LENDNINDRIIYYYNTTPSSFGIGASQKNSEFGHYITHHEKKTIMTPIGFTKRHLSPKNMLLLKERYNIDVIQMFDRVIGTEKNVVITDHINRSGLSFLAGKTPHQNLPMFPNMSNIYIAKEQDVGKCVHTIGPDEFKKAPQEKGVIFSESAAIISTLWHYVGVRIRCLGISENNVGCI